MTTFGGSAFHLFNCSLFLSSLFRRSLLSTRRDDKGPDCNRLHVMQPPSKSIYIWGQDVVLLNASLGNAEDEEKVKDLLHVSAPVEIDESSNKVSPVSWAQHGTHDGFKLKHLK